MEKEKTIVGEMELEDESMGTGATMRMPDDVLEDDVDRVFSDRRSSSADTDLDSKGAIFAKHKNMFLIFGAMIAAFVVVFVLLTAEVIPLWIADCMLIPIAAAAGVAYYFAKKKGGDR